MNTPSVTLAILLFAGLCTNAPAQSTFAPGNLVALRIGDGAATLTSAATPVYLDEITPLGIHVQTITIPRVPASTGNRAATLSGTAGTEGALALSADGRYLTFGGYNAAVGTPAVTSSAVSRVIACIDVYGNVDTTTAFTDDTYAGGSIRSVITNDGSAYWMGGNAGSVINAGVRYAERGSDSSIRLTTAPTNVRIVNIFDGQLYISAQAGAHRGINRIGTGLPTQSGQQTTLLPGFDAITSGPHGYFFAAPDRLYIADDRSLANGGGVQRWDFNGTHWIPAYTMQSGLGAGVRSITGIVEPGQTILYAITAESPSSLAGNRLMRLIDTGEHSEFVLIATAPGNTVYRSVAWAPRSCPPCYANCDGSTSAPILTVDDFTCFINQFAAAQSLPYHMQITHYANCDGSTTVPVLTVDDFTCFINHFAAGCPACP